MRRSFVLFFFLVLSLFSLNGCTGNRTPEFQGGGDGQGISGYRPELPPIVEAIDKSFPQLRRDTTVTITGKNFGGGAKVTIASIDCLFVQVRNSQRLECRMSADVTAPGDVIVTNADGKFATLPPSSTEGWSGASAPQWHFLSQNGSGVDSLNAQADGGQLFSFNERLFSTWVENKLVHVAVYNGNDSSPAWQLVESDPSRGLNYDRTKLASTPSLAMHNSRLYAIWNEDRGNNTGNRIRIAVFNGDLSLPSWSFVDGNQADGITIPSLPTPSSGDFPRLYSFNGVLFGTWWDNRGNGTVHVMAYNGNDSSPSWRLVDGSGTSAIGYNQSGNGFRYPTVSEFNDALYIAFVVVGDTTGNSIRVDKLVGLDSNNASWQLQGSLGNSAVGTSEFPHLSKVGKSLYLTWSETNASNISQIRLSYLSASSAPNWVSVDGGGIRGLNRDVSKNARVPKLIDFAGRPLVVWTEDSASLTVIRASLGSGNESAWLPLDTSASGLNFDSSKAASPASLVLFNLKLYIVWREQDLTVGTRKIAVAR